MKKRTMGESVKLVMSVTKQELQDLIDNKTHTLYRKVYPSRLSKLPVEVYFAVKGTKYIYAVAMLNSIFCTVPDRPADSCKIAVDTDLLAISSSWQNSENLRLEYSFGHVTPARLMLESFTEYLSREDRCRTLTKVPHGFAYVYVL